MLTCQEYSTFYRLSRGQGAVIGQGKTVALQKPMKKDSFSIRSPIEKVLFPV